ncbi:MAG TPA: fibronectin-binding domain-containing protein, partial [Pyrodictium sp.]|nr:fibronectin-binding domain-containing protein [Pyrodictium sp.]
MVKRKESMTSLDIAATIKALESRLIGSRLANIYEIEKNMLLFKFKSPKIETKLVVEPAKRIHATGYEVTEKQMPNPFVMGLRKYLRGARLEKISQIGFDRIVVLEFANGYKLYIELIPRGVIALVDKNNIILQVSEQKKLKDRVIKVKEKYAFPPLKSLHPEQLTPEKLYEDYRSSNEVNIVRFIVKQYGMPPELVEEAVSRSG